MNRNQVTSGNNFLSIDIVGVMANGGPKDAVGLAHSLYFMLIVVIGNYVLLNVFLAIAVDNLTEADLMGGEEEEAAPAPVEGGMCLHCTSDTQYISDT